MSAAPSPGVALEVEDAENGVRLDVLLVRRLEGMSRAEAKRLIAEGAVRLNGRRARKGTRLSSGDAVELDRLPEAREFDPLPSPDLPLTVRHEDASLVVLDKPPRMPSHPLRAHETDTLANALVARYPEMLRVGYASREPGIVHRLDNDTSGLLLAARSHAIFDLLRAALKSGEIEKRYLALAEGRVGSLSPIDLPVGKHPKDPRRVWADFDAPRARLAHTEILRADPVGSHTLLELRAEVAVRHQIRAHLSAIGHPLVGDVLYGGPDVGLGRHFLHASFMAFRHPKTGHWVEVRSELPEDLAACVKALSHI
ncbi:MAG: pseudouridine synthase [Sandaracinaceae bacterium]